MNKYTLLTCLTIAFFCSMTAYAQWDQGTGVLSTNKMVGIGTASPVNALDVRGGINATGSIVSTGSIECNGGDILISRWGDVNQPYGFVARPDKEGYRNLQFSSAGGVPLDNLALNSLLTFTTGRFVINNTSPGSSLDMYFPPDATAKSGLFLHTPTFVNPANAQASYFIKAQDGGTGTFQFIVHGDGTTGINTDAVPGYTLSVNGPGIFTKVVVKPDIWADYVFDSTYALRPLEKVEQYIKDNHHLPEMPSADSVGKAGIDVGANQAALLKKVEELTLYIIEQDKTLRETRQQLGEERAQMKDESDRQRRLQQSQQERIARIERLLAQKLK
jgi:hypothetical protein